MFFVDKWHFFLPWTFCSPTPRHFRMTGTGKALHVFASGDALRDLQLIFFGLNYNELLSVFKVKTDFVQDKGKKSVITKKIWYRKSSAARKLLTKTHYQVWFNVWLKQKAVYEFFIKTYKTYKKKILESPCVIWINRECNYLQIL